jgi:hypothetical protein
MQDLNHVSIFIKPIVDPNRGMDDLAHTFATWNGSAEPRKPAEQIDVVQKSIAKALRCLRKVEHRVFDDFREVS